jgi:hypothetical protein
MGQQAPDDATSRGRSRRVSWKLVMGGLAALTLAALVSAVVIYEKYIQYDRIAALHLPPDTTAAARVDVEKLELYDPVRKHLLPLLDDSWGGPGAGPSSLPPRRERIRVRTGIDPAIDLREIVAARGPTWHEWVVVVSGKFPRRGVVTGMAKVLAEEGAGWRLSPDKQTLLAPTGAALGQAADGSVILASSAARLGQALPSQDTYRRIGLDNQAAAAVAASGQLVRSYASSPARFVAPSLARLQALERVSGVVQLGHPLQATVHVALRPDREAAAMKQSLSALLGGLVRLSALVPGRDFGGERAALGRAVIHVAGPHALDVRFSWKPDEVDRGAISLARAVRHWTGSSPAARPSGGP